MSAIYANLPKKGADAVTYGQRQDSSCRNPAFSYSADDGKVTTVIGQRGKGTLTSYDVFPGIRLIYNDFALSELVIPPAAEERSDKIFEINHCLEGRIECSCEDEFFYLSPGDISIHRLSEIENRFSFPSERYRGVSLHIDTEKAPDCLSCFLNDVNVRPDMLMKKFCDGGAVFVARSSQHLEHIFSELYSIPPEVRKGYFKIKVLEILLFLSALDPEAGERRFYSASQVALAKRIARFLTSHMDEHITINDLSRLFHLSTTGIKNCFKGVYGVTLYSYIRKQKMESASLMLRDSDKTVLEIASLHGYENPSKFASAFKEVMGESPRDFRRKT